MLHSFRPVPPVPSVRSIRPVRPIRPVPGVRGAVAAAAFAALLAACGGGGGGGSAETSAGGTTATPPVPVAVEKPAGRDDAVRFLVQASFGPVDADADRLASVGYAAWIDEQFLLPATSHRASWEAADAAIKAADATKSAGQDQVFESFWKQAATGPDQLRQRVAYALSQIFVISLVDSTVAEQPRAVAAWLDMLGDKGLGTYRELLESVSRHPMMGVYLTSLKNQKADARSGRVPDENYAREVMQLFTIGLHQLNLDGTEKLDSNGKKIETYTQNDVSNLARVFTGYDFDAPASERFTPIGQSYTVEGKGFTTRPMSFKATNHTTLSSSFLNAPTVSADNTNGIALKQTLDILFNHPNVGIFFGKQMIQRFVTSNPSPEYVARVASAFNNNGVGVRGDLKAVWTAIFLDDEARRNFLFSPSSTAPMPEPTDPGAIRNQQGVLTKAIRDLTFGKLREPMIRFIQWGRTFNLSPVSSTYEYWKIPDTSNAADALAQSPLRSPSVFNFFRPAFIPPGTVLVTKNAVAPEFQLVNETTVGGYLNFMQDVVRSGLRSYIDPAVPQASYPSNNGYKLHSAPTYFSELALVADPAALVKRINLLMAAGQISDSNQTLMINAIASMPINSTNATTLEGQRLDRVSAAILMIMASSEYLIQK